MRLLNTTTVELTEFLGEVPPYAILSHTWGDEEVTFQDLELGNPGTTQKQGYTKILGACNQAQAQGSYTWIWIDTCCIDKSSSAELSEAINSMFKWYEKAAICFVYLSDVQDGHDTAQFSSSRWFTRGWTLQELLASKTIKFYTSVWELIGTKISLESQIVSTTGIEKVYISRRDRLVRASVAQRMSWASKRKTTRQEDIAYCLLGVFGVDLPLIYGEGGTKAFLRLQEEIMKNLNDQSIFAWGLGDGGRKGRWPTTYLAPSPHDFINSGDIVCCKVDSDIDLIATYRGITLEAPICRLVSGEKTEYYLPIKCRHRDDVLSLLAIPVLCRDEKSQEYVRESSLVIPVPHDVWDQQSVAHRYLKRTLREENRLSDRLPPLLGKEVALRSIPVGFEIGDLWPSDQWCCPWRSPNKVMGQWTKAVWSCQASWGFVHLKWTGQGVDEAGRTAEPAWPDLLCYISGNPEPDKFGFSVFPEGCGLRQIAQEWEKRFDLPFTRGLDVSTERWVIGSWYIMPTVQVSRITAIGLCRLVVFDVLSSSCRPWSVDACLRDACGLELVRHKAVDEVAIRD
jgi:hypothetical protein